MTDVWKDLGKAVGRALKPLADMAAAIWKSFGDSTGDLIKGFMSGAEDVKTAIEPTITSLLPNVLDEAANALSEGSPPKEIKEAVDKWIEQLLGMIERDSKTEGQSLPTGAQLATTQAKIVAGIMGMYAATHAISIALDATHPLKDWGFKSAIMDMLFQFKMSDVIGPMIQAPIWASVVTPLRMKARAQYPYDVPGSGVLPYLRIKGMLTDEEYKLNMSYHALDASWADHLLLNTARYPSFSELRTMVHRGVKTWPEVKDALQKSLMHTEYLDAFEAAVPSIPSVSDLIRFAVREAYPDAETFTQHYAKMSEWMSKIGYDQYFADASWTAHWIIPSIGQADDMLHRGMITEEQHTGLYILNDIRPEDIENLRALTWGLPGRIEARWMFRWGEIDATDLRDFLVKSGLDPQYADAAARAMAKNQFLSDINRQVANIKGDYARGYSVEATLRSDLATLGMRSDIVEYHVVDALADRVRAIHDEELRTLRAQYARGALTMAEIIEAVDSIILDEVARAAWLAALPTAKQVVIMEETFGAEVNRLVTNAKYDYVRGYSIKSKFVDRLQLLDIPEAVILFHTMDADEDRNRRHLDKRLAITEEGYIDNLISWESVQSMAKEILVDEIAYNLFLDEVWLNKHKAVRVAASE